MKRTHRDGKAISPGKLAEMAETSERSARDVLATMFENGVLKREKNGRRVRYVPKWYDHDTDSWRSPDEVSA